MPRHAGPRPRILRAAFAAGALLLAVQPPSSSPPLLLPPPLLRALSASPPGALPRERALTPARAVDPATLPALLVRVQTVWDVPPHEILNELWPLRVAAERALGRRLEAAEGGAEADLYIIGPYGGRRARARARGAEEGRRRRAARGWARRPSRLESYTRVSFPKPIGPAAPGFWVSLPGPTDTRAQGERPQRTKSLHRRLLSPADHRDYSPVTREEVSP